MITSSLTHEELLRLPAIVDLSTAARALGVGRTKAYELAKQDLFPCSVLRIGTSYRVRTADLLRLVGIERHGADQEDPSDRTGG
ncbi:hypothetical protein DDE19_14805 [Micromonospora ureilytica]|uniref:Helix-turn-helix domain-containing protein n=1 Tax=Micromonospora ureilytica TaxID=709868 RepID=A0A3N9XTU3_9ACTN|nr:helix-turn-helix domain-containing protein [Micromonospora ureilytica]RQX16525.1 hypothetical protein DDE19_14805 [Micromonospora ureilytica]